MSLGPPASFIAYFYRIRYNGGMRVLELGKVERLLSVREAAEYLGVTDGRIRQLLRDGTIRGQKVGVQFWLIPESQLIPLKEPSKIGRPRSRSPQVAN